jgi:hypothetical protein
VDDPPALDATLTNAFQAVSYLANQYGCQLQASFGGRTFFEDAPEPPSEDHLGLYL